MKRRTSIAIDDTKLARVQKVLGTRGVKDTVEAAFDEILRNELRRRLTGRIRTGKGFDRGEKMLRLTRPQR